MIFVKNFKDIKKINFFASLICSPATNHYENFNQVRSFIKTIFIEKPLISKINQFNKIKRNIRKKNITLIVGYVFRFNKAFKFLKKEIKKKKYGKILNIESNYSSFLPSWRNKDYKSTVSFQKKLGGGVVNELSHDLDILVNLFGRIKMKDVKSFGNSDLKSNVEERIFFFGELNKKTPIFIKLSFNEKILSRYLFINFTKGSFFWDMVDEKIYLKHYRGKRLNKKLFSFKNANKKMFEDQIDYILSQKKTSKKNFLNKELNTLKLIHEIKKKI